MTIVANLHIGLPAWTSKTYATGDRVSNSGNAYQCIVAGSSTSAPTGTTTPVNNGGAAWWKWLSAITYTSVSAALAGLPSTFTQPIIWEFWNDGPIVIPTISVPYLTLSGHTTSTTNTLTLTTAPGEGIADAIAAGRAAHAFDANAGVSFTLPNNRPSPAFNYFDVFDKNVIFDGLQFKDPISNSGCTVLFAEIGASGFAIRNCIVDGTAQGGGAMIIDIHDTFSISNLLFIDHQPVGGGAFPIRTALAGNIVNVTAIAPNNPAGTYFMVSNASSSGATTLRNILAFGYAGVGASSVAAANVIIDHCATSASSIGPATSITNNGSNLLSQSATATFISSTSDFGLLMGAPVENAGATDATNVPGSRDLVGLTRPQGTAWDMGAFERPALNLVSVARSYGRGVAVQTGNARGTSRSAARATLTIGPTSSIKGAAAAAGRSAGSFARPLVASQGTAKAIAGSAITAAFPLAAASGNARATARLQEAVLGACIASGTARAFGVATSSPVRALSATGRASSAGRGGTVPFLALVATGPGQSSGRSRPAAALTSTRGKAAARGVGAIATPGVLNTRGRAMSAGRGLALYTAPPALGKGPFGGIFDLIFGGPGVSWGTSESAGRAVTIPITTAALTGYGTASSAGRGTESALDTTAVLAARGFGQAIGTLLRASLAAGVQSRGAAITRGAGRTGLAQPVSATGRASSSGRGGALNNVFLLARGTTQAAGNLALNLAAALASLSSAEAIGTAIANYTVAFASRGTATAHDQSRLTAALRLVANGQSKAAGAIENSGTIHLRSRGLSTATGRTALLTTAAIIARGTTVGRGTASIRCTMALNASRGVSGATAKLDIPAMAAHPRSLGSGRTQGRFAPAASLTTALRTTSSSTSAGRGSARQDIFFTATGYASARGRTAGLSGTTQPRGRGLGLVRGVGVLSYAPINLVGSGTARSTSRARAVSGVLLHGVGIGLSAGRCATTASLLLRSNGRSYAAGRLLCELAFGFHGIGRAAARGRLFGATGLTAAGYARSYGATKLVPYHNIQPDRAGIRLSALTQFPAFDPMDIGDVDFFAWDWSARASLVNDPIVSATVTASPSGMPLGPVVLVGNIVQVRAGAAAMVETYSLRCTVTLRSGRVLHWSAPVPVVNL